MEYVKSNKGGFKLLYDNLMYVKQKVLKNGAFRWECDQRRNKFACKAKLHVLDDLLTTSACEEHFSCFGFMPSQTVVLKTTNLPEVILVTIALSVSYALEKP